MKQAIGFRTCGYRRTTYDEGVYTNIEVQIKYEGYIVKRLAQVDKFIFMENECYSPTIDYASIEGLRLEARQEANELEASIYWSSVPNFWGLTCGSISVVGVFRTSQEGRGG